jgi:hypothetical protein
VDGLGDFDPDPFAEYMDVHLSTWSVETGDDVADFVPETTCETLGGDVVPCEYRAFSQWWGVAASPLDGSLAIVLAGSGAWMSHDWETFVTVEQPYAEGVGSITWTQSGELVLATVLGVTSADFAAESLDVERFECNW